MHTIKSRKILMLKPKEIKIPLFRTRTVDDGYSLYSLADSIKKTGIIVPLAVRKDDGGRYELIFGERRLKAAIMAGLRRVPCVLHDIDSSASAVFSAVENLQRTKLSFFEEALTIKSIILKFKVTHAEMAERLGVSKNALLEKLRLLRLEESLRRRIEEAGLTESHARSLLSLPPDKREKCLERIINENMTALKTESFVDEILNHKLTEIRKLPDTKEKTVSQKLPYRKSSIGDIRLFSNSLQKLTDTLKTAGIDAFVRRIENERYIEYKVRIKKEEPQRENAEQLKIC